MSNRARKLFVILLNYRYLKWASCLTH